MKIGLSVATFATKFGPIVYSAKTLDELDVIFSKVKSYGYDGVDLFIDQINEEKANEISVLLKKNNLEVAMLICIHLAELGVNLSSIDDQHRQKSIETYQAQFNIAKILGAKTMPIGFLRGKLEANDDMPSFEKRLNESLNRLTIESDKFGVKLCIEPINRYEINTMPDVKSVVDFISRFNLGKLKVLPDLFHMNIEDMNIVQSLYYAENCIGHMHVPDSNRMAPGMGHLDFHQIISVLKDIGYDGFLTIEAMPFGEPDACAIQGVKHLREVFLDLDGVNK